MTSAADLKNDDHGRTRGSAWHRRLKIALVVVAAGAGFAYWHYDQYPYGWTHVCDTQLYFALRNYAEDHAGAFPSGKATPEACLSVLYGEPYEANAHLLSGKSIDTEVAAEALANGGLGPASCGWHYVPGLTLNDSPELALFWDKTGLNHNGRRLEEGGHIVWFINGEREHITAAEWPSFLDEQARLRTAAGR